MTLDDKLGQSLKTWQYLTRKKKDELLEQLITGKIPSGEFRR